MNRIELDALKRDILLYLKDETKAELAPFLADDKLHALKKQIKRLKELENKQSSTEIDYQKKKSIRKSDDLFEQPKFKKVVETQRIDIINRKPRVLFICDVKDWAWWIKSEYLKKHLSDEFDIDIKCVLGTGCTNYHKIDQRKYDLYFTYGYSYIDFLKNVPKNKKITGITAHRDRNVIFPRMKIAGYHHANSILLLNELKRMGFKNAFYVPNGVDEELFKPVPIRTDGKMVAGHVGKDSPHKGQKDIIIPAMKKAGVKSVTELSTWQNKRPHKEMPKVYHQMDVMLVASREDGTPNPALEAAACGRPIISNRIGNMPEFIKDGWNGFLLDKPNIDAYVEKLNYFKRNRKELIRMGNNARKTVEEGWTWKIQSENYRNMFNSIFKIKK